MTKILKQSIRSNTELPAEFKMTELEPLPKEWEVMRLGEVASFSRRHKKLSIHPVGLIPFVPMALLPEDSLYITRWEMRHPGEIRSGTFFQDGDLLLARITPCLENGKQGIAKDLPSGWGFATTEVFPIRPRNNLQIEFLALYLKMPSVRASLAEKMEGTTGRQRLPKAVIEALLIPLPPLLEQQAIAHVLRTVQRAKEATERVIQVTRELKKSLMRHLFTYGPVPLEEVEKVSLKETAIGPLPEEWEVVQLGDIFEIQQGKALSPKHRAGKSPCPFLRTANVFWGRIDLSTLDKMDFTEKEVQRLRLLPGDLLVCEGGDIGRTAIWRGELQHCCYQNHLHRLRAKYGGIEPQFYMYWMQAAILLFGLYLGQGNKTTIPNLSKARLSSFNVPLPPLPEQDQITRILRAVDKKLQAEETRKQALDALFKTLLHNLMTGQIRVKDLALPGIGEVARSSKA